MSLHVSWKKVLNLLTKKETENKLSEFSYDLYGEYYDKDLCDTILYGIKLYILYTLYTFLGMFFC